PAPAGPRGQRAGGLREVGEGADLPRPARRAAPRRALGGRAALDVGAPSRPLGRLSGRGQLSERTVEHAIFVVERHYDAAPERVFAAWATRDAKAQWFGSPADRFELDFRIGGRELHHGTDPQGNPYTFAAIYQDIVPSERILYTYEMLIRDTRISV